VEDFWSFETKKINKKITRETYNTRRRVSYTARRSSGSFRQSSVRVVSIDAIHGELDNKDYIMCSWNAYR
jgi:hypothetical protein